MISTKQNSSSNITPRNEELSIIQISMATTEALGTLESLKMDELGKLKRPLTKNMYTWPIIKTKRVLLNSMTLLLSKPRVSKLELE